MAIERWDPFSEMMRFRNLFDRMLGEAIHRPWRQALEPMGYSLPLDVCETDDEYIVRAAVPGVRPEDLDITVKEDTVTIRGQVQQPEWLRRETFQQEPTGQRQPAGQASQAGQPQPSSQARAECWLQEIPYGRFTRSITLPTPINSNTARADFDNGLLILHLPKTAEARPRRIEVQPGAQRQQIGAGAGGTSRQPGQR